MTDDAGRDTTESDSGPDDPQPAPNADPDAPVDFTPGELTGPVDADDDGHDAVDEPPAPDDEVDA